MILNRFEHISKLFSRLHRKSNLIIKYITRNVANVFLEQLRSFLLRVTHYTSYTNSLHYTFQRVNMEVCHPTVMTTTSRDVLLPMPHFTFAQDLHQGHSRRSSASRVHSLSLSVNLKSNYTRLRSQAVTQFVVILGASIPGHSTTQKLLETR